MNKIRNNSIKFSQITSNPTSTAVVMGFVLFCLLHLTQAIQAQEDYANAVIQNNCATCHSPRSVTINPKYPILDGQKAGYLVRQMLAYQNGSRKDAQMQKSVRGLSSATLYSIAQYYSSRPPLSIKSEAPLNEDGRNVRAYCIACHGVNGVSVNAEWPNLAGQNKEYIVQQLQKYADDTRKHPLMNVISKEINQQQMVDVAEYYSQIKQN